MAADKINNPINLLKPSMYKLTILTLIIALISPVSSAAATPVKDVTLLGLKLVDLNQDKVRNQLWNIGGFLQAKSTIKQRNLDKFFAWSNIRDSYYVEFRYNSTGKVHSVKRLYRSLSIEHSNLRTPLKTREVARKLIPKIGQPTQVIRKSWGGSPSYPSFIWEDDQVKVILDREGSEIYGNIFVKYIIKNVDPFFVEVEPEKKKP